ncbi:peptidoglycan-binding protein [Brucella anthropi]|uniref:Peptidoglycan-binding protein n=1 Tax=Brucella anthropi TaxID=529 RepID=A0A6I0D248_BRUAN|nr:MULTISPECIES: peptidoglycan-binding protein [Brucella/Ochrobactrum group]MCR5939402.1 peptidoglycan-binding protein [Ochrobactrum sp. XJ1]KAB2734322.1 peptidoglycan-binding protein [Brucella anthropi]KAB2758110.1 peptidoglycan-binding protein [Brucella anthropi]KAB2764656.1 peptidoglycan-binding protein [Brucella anthropi]KAB2769622.1 peptidoglycan-binding protein [Brucella anthropi]
MANPDMASGSRSIIDDLNAHRERRASSPAMEELNRTLASLEKRLMDLEHDSAPDVRDILRSERHPVRHPDETVTGLAEIAENLRRMRGSHEEPQPHYASSAEVSRASREMTRLQRAASEEGFSQQMSDDFERINDSVRLLAERSSEANAQALRRQLEELHRTVQSLAREETLHRLNNRWDRFDARFEAFEQRHNAVDPALDAIGSRLEQVRDAIGTLPQSNRLSAIEDRIGQLANSIEESLSPQHASSLDQSRLQQIDERLDEISRAIIATSRAQRPDQDSARRLERIESRLAELAEQLATSATQQNSDTLYRKLGELSSRIDGLSSGSALPEGVIDQLAHQINLLANQVGKVMENLNQSDYHAVEARLEAIGEKLEAAERRVEEPHPSVLDKIDRRFAELTERLDAQYATQHVDNSAIHTLEGRLDDLSQQISLGLLQAPTYDGPGLDVKAIRSLEDQIANIAHHLAQPVAELAELKPRLDSIERSIASNRETVLDAAREAAESAVARVLQHGSHGDSVIARQLAEDMKSLEALARNSDERNGKTFETVHDTLVKIVDRLARLEQDVAGKSDTSDTEKSAFTSPNAGSPRPSAPRSPAAAAAEAAFATVQSEAGPADMQAGDLTGKSSLFGGFAKAIRGRRADKSVGKNDETLEASAFDATLDAPAFESDLAAIEPITREEPELETTPSPRPQGEGMPDLNSIMKRVREERRQREDAADLALAANGKVDFITAARRAAQLAAAESEQLQKGTTKRTGKKKSSVGDMIQRQRKPILMAIGAVMIAMAGLQIGSAFLNRDEPVEAALDTVPPQIDTTAADNTPAPADEIAAKIASDTTPALEQSAETTPVIAEPRAEKIAQEEIPKLANEQQAAVEIPTQIEQPAAATGTTVHPVAPAETATSTEPAAQPQATIPSVPEEAGPAALREAAAKGDARALFEVGNRYMEGRGVAADFAKAAKWYEISAGQGFAPAQYRLGNFNEKGLGMARDLEKAKTWYQLSAQQGNASAMHNLAVLFATGANGNPDNASAVRWFTDAAELGVKDSQFNLGILAAKGLGMPVNLEESYKWFSLAANAGDKDAADKRDQIAKALKPEQLERAKDLVKLWKAKPLDQATNSIDVPDAWTESKPLTTGSVDMKKAVRNIQLILQKNGYDVGTADGLMGGKTRAAIAAFQKANGQTPTGDVDQKLVQLLLEKNK